MTISDHKVAIIEIKNTEFKKMTSMKKVKIFLKKSWLNRKISRVNKMLEK